MMTCQSVMWSKDGSPFHESPLCGKPAKAWIKDALNRSGWNGRQYLCGLHANAHDKTANKLNRPVATRL